MGNSQDTSVSAAGTEHGPPMSCSSFSHWADEARMGFPWDEYYSRHATRRSYYLLQFSLPFGFLPSLDSRLVATLAG